MKNKPQDTSSFSDRVSNPGGLEIMVVDYDNNTKHIHKYIASKHVYF